MAQPRPEPLLTTKLHLPPLRPDFIPRRRLTAKLNQAPSMRLSLVMAPAGFGKTTLVREWVEGWGQPVAWLSLDEQDNSLPRFLLYLIQACREVKAGLGDAALELLQATHLPHTSTLLTYLSNELAALPDPGLIVLDDYHLIETPAIHEAMDFLIAHLPAQSKLIQFKRLRQ